MPPADPRGGAGTGTDRGTDDGSRTARGAATGADGATDGEGLPYFVGSWRTAYLIVLANLAVNVALFYLLRRIYE
jgi:hypothetical protein